MEKVFEVTTNEKDGYRKYYVRGLKSETEARALAKRVFGKFYWDAGGAVSYYDDHPSKYGNNWSKNSYTQSEFLKLKEDFTRRN